MKPLPVVLRESAAEDVQRAIGRYADEGGPAIVRDFVDSLESALAHLGFHPASGSPRYATELDLPGLRYWVVDRFPYLVFYIQRESCVDVWRILHAHRDMPASLNPQAPAPRGRDEVREASGAGYAVRGSRAGRPGHRMEYGVLHDEVW